MHISRLIKPDILELIEKKDWNQLKDVLSHWPAPDIADFLMDVEMPVRIFLFRSLPGKVSADVFSYLESRDKDELLQALSVDETRYLLADLSPDDRTELFEDLPGQVIQRLLNLLSPHDYLETVELLGYPEESVGRLMTPDYVAIRPSWTVEQALDHIRRLGKDSETINVIFITDESWRLIDSLGLRKLILANPTDTIEQLMDYRFISISALEDREKAVELINRYDLVALAVVDNEGILLGIVTVDDVIDVASQEITEDFQMAAAVTPLKESYSEASIWFLYRKRIGWLAFLLLVGLVSSTIIAHYEKTLSAAIVLTVFLPLLIDSGGNTGAQSSTLIVRAIAVGDVELVEWLRTLARELLLGMTLGATMGFISWFLGFFVGGFSISLIVASTMFSIVLVANIIGAALPLVLTRFGFDPAVASSPLITSIVDVIGLIIYLSIATYILAL